MQMAQPRTAPTPAATNAGLLTTLPAERVANGLKSAHGTPSGAPDALSNMPGLKLWEAMEL